MKIKLFIAALVLCATSYAQEKVYPSRIVTPINYRDVLIDSLALKPTDTVGSRMIGKIVLHTNGGLYVADGLKFVPIGGGGDANTVPVATMSELQSYFGPASIALVSDSLRGGTFTRISTNLTADSGVIFPAQGGGVWRRVFNPADGYKPEWWGAKKDATTDNTRVVQMAQDYIASRPSGSGSNILKFGHGEYMFSSLPLYIYGNVSWVGEGGSSTRLYLKGISSTIDSNFAIVFGIKRKVQTVKWTDAKFEGFQIRPVKPFLSNTVLNIFSADNIQIKNNRFFFDDVDSTAGLMTGIESRLDAAWCTSSSKSNITISDNNLTSKHTYRKSGEAIGLTGVTNFTIKDNYVNGFGDDGIGIHASTQGKIENNRMYLLTGRIYLGNSTSIDVTKNYIERIADPLGFYHSGGAFIHTDLEIGGTSVAPADINVVNNTLKLPAGMDGDPINQTYMIRFIGVQNGKVIGNTMISNTALRQSAINIGPIYKTGWTGPAGSVDFSSGGKSKPRNIIVEGNIASGTYPGEILENANLASEIPGPIGYRNNAAKYNIFSRSPIVDPVNLKYIDNATSTANVDSASVVTFRQSSANNITSIVGSSYQRFTVTSTNTNTTLVNNSSIHLLNNANGTLTPTSVRYLQMDTAGLVATEIGSQTDISGGFGQGGNNFGATGVLGTTVNPLKIIANNIEHLYVTDDSSSYTVGTERTTIKNNPSNTSGANKTSGWMGNYINSLSGNNYIYGGGSANFINKIWGTEALRAIIDGYDNTISMAAASRIAGMHSYIGRNANHATIIGATTDTSNSGGYTNQFGVYFGRIGYSDTLNSGNPNSWSTQVGGSKPRMEDSTWFGLQAGVKDSWMRHTARSGQYSVDLTTMDSSLSSLQAGGISNYMNHVTNGVQLGGRLNNSTYSNNPATIGSFDLTIDNSSNSAGVATVSSTIKSATNSFVGGGSNHKIYGGEGQVSLGGGNIFDSTTVNDFSVAIGMQNKVGGLGIRTQAGIAMGRGNIVSGDYSFAIGDSNTANGKNVFALGYHANNTGQGSFLVTDGTGTGASNSITHKFVGSFLNGYDFKGSRGITIPSLTSFQILNIVSPVDGELVYNNQKQEYWHRNGVTSKWRKILRGDTTTITDGMVPIGKTSTGDFAMATITGGSGVSVTNGSGSITISTNADAIKVLPDANYTITITDNTLILFEPASARTLTLPAASTMANKRIKIVYRALTTGRWILSGSFVQRATTGTIASPPTENFTNSGLTIGTTYILESDGSKWYDTND